MAVNSEFNAGAVELIKSRGDLATYNQAGQDPAEFRILIEHDLEIIDPESGAGTYVTAALYAKSDFPLSEPKIGDAIIQNSRTWNVTRHLEDDGYLVTLEVI